MRRLVAVATLALVLSGPAVASAPKPEAFMRKVLEATVESKHVTAWTLLHPAHQKLAPRARFIACRKGDRTVTGYTLVSAKAIAKRYERIEVPFVPEHTSTAITLRFVVRGSAGQDPPTDAVVHAVWTGKRWAWVRPTSEIASFRAGECP